MKNQCALVKWSRKTKCVSLNSASIERQRSVVFRISDGEKWNTVI